MESLSNSGHIWPPLTVFPKKLSRSHFLDNSGNPANQPLFFIGNSSTYLSFTVLNGTVSDAFFTNFKLRYVVNNVPIFTFYDPE